MSNSTNQEMKQLRALVFSFFTGAGITLWAMNRPIFEPFDFRIIRAERFEVFLQQRIDLPFPMTPHRTEVWVHDLRNQSSKNGWQYAGKVITEPFDLSEAKVLDDRNNTVIDFPLSYRLVSKDLEYWTLERRQ